MLKNRYRRAVLAGILAVAMTASCPIAAMAETGTLCKNETVYVITDPSGSAKKTIVTDRIAGSASAESVADSTSLKNIEVVKGDAAKSGSGSSVTWTTNGSEVSYRGTTDKKTPVTMKVEYYLDGKSISGSKLQGKSGDVRIVISYINNTRPCVPFICASGFAVTDGCLSDITVDGGKAIEDGERTLVCGFATPGVGSAVGSEAASRIGLRDSITIRAKAKNFSISEIMTMVTANLTDEINPDALDLNIDMGDGTAKLKKGADDVRSGADKLAGGSSKLKSGIDELSRSLMSSLGELESGAGSIRDALGTSDSEGMRKGTAELAAGAGAVKQGSDATMAALKGAESQLAALKEANPDVDFTALEQTIAAAETASAKTGGYAEAVREGSLALKEGTVKLSEGAMALCSGIEAASSADGKLSAGLGALSSGASQLSEGSSKLAKGAGKLSDGIELADEMISELTDELSSELGSVKTVLNAGRSYDNFSGIAGGMSGTVKFIYKTELGTDR